MPDDTDRVSVQTYVPRYQREIWRDEAEEMDMSQAEFVRTMVQAGRDRFDLSPIEDSTGRSEKDNVSRPSVQHRVREALSVHGPLEWEELVEVLTEDIEAELERSLEELQDANTVLYTGREGGYTLRDDDDVK